MNVQYLGMISSGRRGGGEGGVPFFLIVQISFWVRGVTWMGNQGFSGEAEGTMAFVDDLFLSFTVRPSFLVFFIGVPCRIRNLAFQRCRSGF